MRKTVLFLFSILLVSAAAAEVQYSINADKDSVDMNSTVELECGATCPGLTWRLVDGAEVRSVRDGGGEIEDYQVSGNEVSIPGRRSRGSDTRVIQIHSHLGKDAEEIHAGLYKRTLRLSGFNGEITTGTVRSGSLISGRTGFGFGMSFTDGRMDFQGDGPVNIRMKFGDGYETEYFSFFGDRPVDTEIAYEIPVGTLGIVQDFERFPVAVHTDESYDSNINEWSAGEYVSGAIQIRDQESIEEEFIPVLAHEVVHGLNDRELNWDSTRSSYFDEGTGKYVEFLVKKKLEGQDRTREIFGEEVTYTEEKDGQRYRYTLPSKGDPGQLWNYYQNERDFMKQWSAMNSDPDTRKFGYAYSELVIRNYIARDNGSLRQLYDRIDVSKEVEDPEVKWGIYSQHLDMTPCNYDSRERFDRCLDEVNSYDYRGDRAKDISRENNRIEIEPIEIPNRTSETGNPEIPGSSADMSGFLRQFVEYWVTQIGSFLQSLAASF